MALEDWDTEVGFCVHGEGTRKQTQAQVSELTLGDGYQQSIPIGINSMPRLWSLSHVVTGTEERTINDFLRPKKGVTPFTWTPPSEDGVDGTVQVRCVDYSFVYHKGSTHTFSALFQEDFTQVEGSVSTPAEVPTISGIEIISTSAITITWTDISGDQAYVVERSTDGSSYSEINTTANNVTTYADTGLSAGVTYYYRVKQVGGLYSNIVTGVTGSLADQPTLTGLNVVSATNITITWTDLPGDQAYVVERSTDGSSYSDLATTANNVTTYADTSVSASTQYYYRVRVAP